MEFRREGLWIMSSRPLAVSAFPRAARQVAIIPLVGPWYIGCNMEFEYPRPEFVSHRVTDHD